MSRSQDAADRVSEAHDDGTPTPLPLLAFSIPGDPVAKGRGRAVVNKKTLRVRVVTPKTTRTYESIVRDAAAAAVAQAGGSWPLAGPLNVEIRAVFRRPGRLFRRADPDGLIPHDRRPDLDNVVKAVLDGMDGAGVWQDDAQVAQLTAAKFYGRIVGERREKRSQPPHVFVVVSRVIV